MITGVILAGGLSSRMGGGDKSLKALGGVPILLRVIRRVAPQVERLIINANGDPERFETYDLPVVADDLPDHPGPLAGILAGMDYAAEMTPAKHIVTFAADCPFLPKDIVPRLMASQAVLEAQIAVAHSGGFSQPTIALWDVSLRHDLRSALVEEGLRKIDAFTARYKVAAVEWQVEPCDPFFNANTLEDIAEAERLLLQHPDL